MTPTETVKQYGETVVTVAKPAVLAAIGAGDLAVERARSTAHQLAVVARPEALRSSLTGLVETARTQALATIGTLAGRGAEVVDDLRQQPGIRRVVRRAERAVDTVEETLEDVLEETAEAVAGVSDEVTSVAQKTAARTSRAAAAAEEKVADVAEEARAAAGGAVATDPVKKTTAARTAPARATTARVTRARTARPADPTAVPAKS